MLEDYLIREWILLNISVKFNFKLFKSFVLLKPHAMRLISLGNGFCLISA